MALSPFHGPCGIHLNSMALEKPESRFQINICYPPREREFRGQAMRRNVNMYQGNKGGIKKKKRSGDRGWVRRYQAWQNWKFPKKAAAHKASLRQEVMPDIPLQEFCFTVGWQVSLAIQKPPPPPHPPPLHPGASLLPSPPAPEGRGSVSIGKCPIGA